MGKDSINKPLFLLNEEWRQRTKRGSPLFVFRGQGERADAQEALRLSRKGEGRDRKVKGDNVAA